MYSDTLTKLNYNEKTIVVMYSGGMGSFLTAYLLKVQGFQNVTLYFNDTHTEDEDLYRFLEETKGYLGFKFIDDSDGRDIWQVFKDRKYMGNSRVDTCSEVLKRNRSKRLMKLEDTKVLTGVGVWESDRLDKAGKYWPSGMLGSALIDAEVYDTKALEEEALSVSGIKRPRLYDMGFSHNNCGGFCVKAGLKHYKNLWEVDPSRYKYFESKEQEVYDAVPKAKPFLKKQVDGVRFYISLREYREQYLEVGNAFDKDDDTNATSCMSCALN